MAEQEIAGVNTLEGDIDVLTDLVGTASVGFNASNLHLFQNTFTPTPASKQADFAAAECSFTGYAAVALTWSAVSISVDADAISQSNRAFYQATDAVTPQTAGGFWIEGHDSISLVYGVFGTPIQFLTPLAFAGVTLTINREGVKTADVEY